MKKKLYLLGLLGLLVFTAQCGSEPNWESPPDQDNGSNENITPPGVVVNHSKKSTKVFLGTPSICILPNGDYLISHDESGAGTVGAPNATHIFKSSDKGKTWSLLSSIKDGQTWSGLFTLNNELYIFGASGPVLKCIVRKSTDSGVTWTTPTDFQNGVIYSGRCHTSSVPVVMHNNRIWRAIELKDSSSDVWPRMYNAHILSAPITNDYNLLVAANWVKSNELKFNPSYLNGTFGGWLEGNVVVDKSGKVKLIMRVEIPNGLDGEYIAIIDVSDDGKTISFDPATGFVKMPGGAKKFTIKYDEVSNRYWTLSNYVDPSLGYMNPGAVRNILTLCSSEDLRTWTAHKIILQNDDVKYHGFQYLDWMVEGNDMIAASRTAYDDAYGGADSYHNSNYITFHRIENFRSYINETIDIK